MHNVESRFTASYYSMYQLRRIFFVLTAFVVTGESKVSMTLLGLRWLNLFNTIYIGSAKFWLYRPYTYLEMFNELLVAMVCYEIVWFTDFLPTPEAQYEHGWFTIYTAGVFLFVNFCCMMSDFYKTMSLFYIKYKLRI